MIVLKHSSVNFVNCYHKNDVIHTLVVNDSGVDIITVYFCSYDQYAIDDNGIVVSLNNWGKNVFYKSLICLCGAHE